MQTLRQFIDSGTKVQPGKPAGVFQPKDQVVFKKAYNRTGAPTKEVMVGTIAAMAGDSAIVSFPRPGGRLLRSTVPISQLEHVCAVFKRNSVQFNPGFRGIYMGSV